MIKTKINKKKKIVKISKPNETILHKLFFINKQLIYEGYDGNRNLILTERLKIKQF